MPRPDREAPPKRLLTRGFAALLVAQAGFGYAFSSFFLLPKYLVVELGAGPTEIGLVTAAYGVVIVCFMPVMGAVVDRFGRRDFLTAGALVMALASLGFVWVDRVGPLIYALRAVQAVAFSMAYVAGAALAVDEAPPERVGQAIGLFGLTFLSMNAVAPASIEAIAPRAGWSVAFAVAAAGAVLCAVLSRFLHERPRPEGGGEAGAGLVAFATRSSQLRIMAVIALVGTGMCALFVYHQPFALELGITRLRGFFIAYAVTAFCARVFFGQQIDRAGRRRVALATLSLYVVVVTGMIELGRVGLVPFGIGLGLAHGLFYPAFNAVAVDGAGLHERGKAMALFQAAFHLGFSCGGLALGLIAAHAGYPAVFAAGGACTLLAFGLLLASPEGRPRAAD